MTDAIRPTIDKVKKPTRVGAIALRRAALQLVGNSATLTGPRLVNKPYSVGLSLHLLCPSGTVVTFSGTILLGALGCFPQADLSEYSLEGNETPSAGGQAGALGGGAGTLDGGQSAGGMAGSSDGTGGVAGSAQSPTGGAGGGPALAADASAEASLGEAGTSTPVPDATPPSPTPEELCDGVGGLLEPDTRNCILVESTPLNFATATAECVTWGGALIRLEAEPQDSFVTGALQAAGFDDAWIGLSDPEAMNAASTQFVWADGTPYVHGVDFANWSPFEPDSTAGQFCVEKRMAGGSNGAWFDQVCTATKPYVCEQEV